jgi:signal transduction histidine kinase
VGIPSQRIDNIFQIDNNNSTLGTANEEGTGLGLILCKMFVEKSGGWIKVMSEEGKGSVFSFSIRL